MKIVRRWYIYLVSAVSLQIIVWGLIGLLRGLLPPGPRIDLLQATLLLATLIVGLPFFFGHWWWGEQLFRRDPEEQASAVRRLYLYALLAAFLFPIVFQLLGLLQNVLLYTLAETAWAQREGRVEIADAAIALLVLAPLLAGHIFLLRRDLGRVAERGELADIRRWFVFGFNSLGLFMTLSSTIFLLQILLIERVRPNAAYYDWREEFFHSLPALICGLLLWLFFWRWAGRLFTALFEEQESTLRKVYLYLVVFINAAMTVGSATLILDGGLRRLLNVPTGGDVREGLTVILVMGLSWLYHSYVLRQDSQAAAEAPRQAAVRRLYLYLVAAVGLAAFLIGLAGLVNVFFHWLEFRTGLSLSLRRELAGFLAALLAGLPVWLLPWWRVEKTAGHPGPRQIDERRSLVRRIYLYFYLFVTTMTVLGTAIYVVSQILYLILGGRSGAGFIGDIAEALAFSLIAGVVWFYHIFILRGDGRFGEEIDRQQLADFRLVVIDPLSDQGTMAPLIAGLRSKLPAESLYHLQWPPDGEETTATHNAALEALNKADLIVTPWTALVSETARPESTELALNEQMQRAITGSPAAKLLLPLADERWYWAGLPGGRPTGLTHQVVKAVEQAAAGQEITGSRFLSTGTIIGLILAALVTVPLLLMLIVGLIEFIIERFF